MVVNPPAFDPEGTRVKTASTSQDSDTGILHK